MKSSFEVSCPVSSEKINEYVARTAAIFVWGIALVGLYTDYFWVILLLGIDFGFRAFSSGDWSFIKLLSRSTTRLLVSKVKLTDAAPKKFAAGIGMAFCFLIAICQWLGFTIAAETFGSLLLACAFLEGVFGYCVGCMVYSYVVLPFRK